MIRDIFELKSDLSFIVFMEMILFFFQLSDNELQLI